VAVYIVTYSGCSIHDGTLLHSKSKYTTVKHSRQLSEHTFTSNPHGLGTLTPIEFFQQDLLWQSLPFLQSENIQIHVGKIHRRAIGPLAHHNGTPAYSPSLTCRLPAPTIGCLHSNDSQTTLSLYQSKFRIQLIPYPWRCLSIVSSVTMLLVYIVIHQSR
jgi:hypothetical protein